MTNRKYSGIITGRIVPIIILLVKEDVYEIKGNHFYNLCCCRYKAYRLAIQTVNKSAVGETSDVLISSSDADSEKLIENTVSRIKETGFSLDITQYYDFQKAEWKQDAQAEIQQMQYNSPSSFSRIVSKVYAILDEYEQNVRLG